VEQEDAEEKQMATGNPDTLGKQVPLGQTENGLLAARYMVMMGKH
jgi:hypothetical protein